jgi:hypothetical protein
MGYLSNESYQSNQTDKIQSNTFDILHASVITFESKRKDRSKLHFQSLWLSQPARRIRIQKFMNRIVDHYYAQGE